VIVETIDYRKILDWVNAVWAKSLAAVLMFVIGIWIGQVQVESRVIGDCKYAGAFRVDHQAFVCQRRI
jgi:alpha/beta superfamily hydrolase